MGYAPTVHRTETRVLPLLSKDICMRLYYLSLITRNMSLQCSLVFIVDSALYECLYRIVLYCDYSLHARLVQRSTLVRLAMPFNYGAVIADMQPVSVHHFAAVI